MKSFNKLIALIIAGLCCASCDYLDVVPDNIATVDHAFADRYTAEMYLATCYWNMPRSGSPDDNPGIYGALEMIVNRERIGITRGFQFGLGYASPTAPLINYWGERDTNASIRMLYAGINDCNTFLENIGKVMDLNAYEKRRWVAEVTLIKAYLHFYLLAYYGPICPLRQNTPVDESTRGVRVYREKIDDCFAYVFELIDEVIDSEALPGVIANRTTELGRFTQAAACMLRAKASMYWASPLFNGNTDYNSFRNQNGEPFFNQTYDAARWQQAADDCKKAIEVCESSGIRLFQMTDYVTAKTMTDSTRIVNTLRSAVTERWNCELIWGNTASYVNWGLQSPCFPRLEQGTLLSTSGVMSVPLHVVDWFYSQHGVPIEEDPSYPYSTRFNVRNGDVAHRSYLQQNEPTAVMNFYREPRFYSTLGFDRGKWYGNHHSEQLYVHDWDAQCPRNLYNEYSSIWEATQYNATGYWPKKLVSINSTFRDANSVTYEDYPFPEMRYADLLLLYAEALNEVKDSPDNEVYQHIDEVRARAGLEGVVDSWRKYSSNPTKPSTKAGMREIIRRERAIELACEGHYYWDSRRWKTALREQNRLIQGWDVLKVGVMDYYSVVTLYIQEFAYRNYFAPIPESDIITNPLLVQNPGW